MAKATDDFDWPPKGDDLAIYEIGPDPWQKLQDASRDAFLARQRELVQPPPRQTPRLRPAKRTPLPTPREPAPAPRRTLARIVIASVVVAAVAGWAIQATTTPAAPVQTFHHPAPVAAPTPPPPPIKVVATYPVPPAVPAPAPVEPVDVPSAASIPADEQPSQVTPVDTPPSTDATAAPADTAAPDGGPAAVEPATTPPPGI